MILTEPGLQVSSGRGHCYSPSWHCEEVGAGSTPEWQLLWCKRGKWSFHVILALLTLPELPLKLLNKICTVGPEWSLQQTLPLGDILAGQGLWESAGRSYWHYPDWCCMEVDAQPRKDGIWDSMGEGPHTGTLTAVIPSLSPQPHHSISLCVTPFHSELLEPGVSEATEIMGTGPSR